MFAPVLTIPEIVEVDVSIVETTQVVEPHLLTQHIEQSQTDDTFTAIGDDNLEFAQVLQIVDTFAATVASVSEHVSDTTTIVDLFSAILNSGQTSPITQSTARDQFVAYVE